MGRCEARQVRVHEVAHLAAALETTGEGFLQQQKERLESMVVPRLFDS